MGGGSRKNGLSFNGSGRQKSVHGVVGSAHNPDKIEVSVRI